MNVKMRGGGRVLSNSEQNWCRALAGGTATTAIVLEMAKPPSKISLLYEVLAKLRQAHPALRYKLHYNPTTNEYSFLNPSSSPSSTPTIQFHDVSTTTHLLRNLINSKKSNVDGNEIPECQLILEHELNNNTWRDPKSFPPEGIDVVFASVYALSETKGMVVLRLHVSVCDRTTGESLLLELMELVVEAEGGRKMGVINNQGEGEKAVEDLVPTGMGKKTMWAHGIDMLGYSLNSLRLTNLKFNTTKRPRYSEVVRLQMNTHQTARLLAGCKSRGIKLCGALAAAGLMAAHSTTRAGDDKLIKKKYGVVTLVDCRSLLEPPLSSHHFGFYQLPLLNIQSVNGSENLWDLAEKTYRDFAGYKECNKQFSDLGDINFLMRRAMENPSVTPSSSLRTSLISVFEDPVIDNTKEMKRQIGVDEYLGCSSAHGIGPSIAFFDTIRDGELECTVVYPAPLHSRDQITHLLSLIKNILINAPPTHLLIN